MSRAGASSIKKEDRLFSLILALLASRDGLTKQEILSTVRGYSDVYTHTVNKSLEKMFERDKSKLRSMGVVIDTVEPFGEEGETHNVRYLITHRNFELPEDFTFTPEELTLLTIASQAWRQGSLSSDSRHALTKIKSLGINSDDSLIGIAPAISTFDRAFDVVANALQNELILEFQYLKPGQNMPQSRTVAPLALVQWNGYWHMLGFDLVAEAERTFLLRRIVGDITHRPQETFARDAKNYADQILSELAALSAQNFATLAVTAGSDAFTRLKAHGATVNTQGDLQLHYTDEDLLADMLVSFGSTIRVLSPQSLDAKIKDRFNLIVQSLVA